MAERGWTRHGALALCVLSAALLGACGQEENAANSPGWPREKIPARQFNSRLAFYVCAHAEGNDTHPFPSSTIGVTPCEPPLLIPSGRSWSVRPLSRQGRPDYAMVAREIEAQRIPGLILSAVGGRWTDADLVHFKHVTGLETLYLLHQATDACLAQFKEARELRTLSLWGSPITDAGLVYLKEMKGLRTLNLCGTRVTDAGLAYLKDLKELRALNLTEARVTDAGLAHLKELEGLQKLYLPGTKVTDAGLVHLQELKGLQRLNVDGTGVTRAGFAKLQKSLPNLERVVGPSTPEPNTVVLLILAGIMRFARRRRAAVGT